MKLRRFARLALAVALALHGTASRGEHVATAEQAWTDLQPLPEKLAGQCVGVSGKWLVVAGGSLWSAPPWNGGVKTWSDRVYGLQAGASQWKLLGTLPVAMGYGAGAQWGNHLLCAGGQNATEIFRTVYSLTVHDNGELQVEQLPELPTPLTNATAAVAENRLYVFGGQNTLHPQDTAKHGLQLDLHIPASWQPLKTPWEHAKILPAMAGCGANIFVGGGADLHAAADGSPVREYLKDAWRLDTRTGQWHGLPALPAGVTAAPSACSQHGDWLIFGGDDGVLAHQIQTLRDAHPGFRKQVLQFNTTSQRWQVLGELPLSLVTTNVALWHGHYVIAGGENQPGHRSSRVISFH